MVFIPLACLIIDAGKGKTSSNVEVKERADGYPGEVAACGTCQGAAAVNRDLGVGELAARSGVSVSTLHFYEQKGLIHSMRTSGNQRRYARDVLRRIAVIKVAQRTGMPLALIRDALSTLPDGRTPTAADWKRLSRAWRSELDARIVQLTQLRDQLDGCIGCGCLSLKQCPLRNPGDQMAAHGPGANMLGPI